MAVSVLDHEASWLAAAIDGEGSIVRKGPRVRLIVYNTNRAFVENAARLMGSTVGTNSNPNSISKTPKPMNSTECSDHKRALIILQFIEPFLIIKKIKAQAAIESIKTHSWGKWNEESKKNHSGTMKRNLAKPEVKQKMRRKALARWQDPVYRAKWQEARHGGKKA